MSSKRGRTPLYLDNMYQYRTPAQRSGTAEATTAADPQGSFSASSSHSNGVADPSSSVEAHDGRATKRGRRLQRACTFCRRSHLVCEEQRPCRRCVKRGIAAQCEEDDKEQQQTMAAPASARAQPAGARLARQTVGKTDSVGKAGRMVEHHQHRTSNGSPAQSLVAPAPVASAPMQSYQQHADVNHQQSTAPHAQPLLVSSTLSGAPLVGAAPLTSTPATAGAPWDDALFTSFFFDQDFSTHSMLNAPNVVLPTNFVNGTTALHPFAATGIVQRPPVPLELPLAPPPPTTTAATATTRRRSSVRLSPPPTDAALPRKRTKWFEPLPFRKGYASIVHHLQRNRWQPRNVDSVKQALASVAQLWDAREDSMQFSDLLQVHAQWATYLNVYRDQVFPHTPIAMLACRKAGEIYAVSAAALQMFKRPASDFEDGQLAVYQLMSEDSAADFFRLYEQAIRRRTLAASATREGSSVTLHWNARLTVHSDDGDGDAKASIATRGVFHIKFTELELPCLLVLSFIPL